MPARPLQQQQRALSAALASRTPPPASACPSPPIAGRARAQLRGGGAQSGSTASLLLPSTRGSRPPLGIIRRSDHAAAAKTPRHRSAGPLLLHPKPTACSVAGTVVRVLARTAILLGPLIGIHAPPEHRRPSQAHLTRPHPLDRFQASILPNSAPTRPPLPAPPSRSCCVTQG